MNTKIAIVGLGDAGHSMHLPALSSIGGATVVGVCDPDATRLSRSVSRYRVPGFDSFEEMLSRANPECVIIATPPDTHPALCLEAIGAGCNVLCEKPFTPTIEDADIVIEAAKVAGKRIAVNHEFREMPIFRSILDGLEKNPASRVVFAQAWQQVDLSPAAETSWRGAMRRRVLPEAGVHLIDFMMAVFKECPVEVSAVISDGDGVAAGSDAVSAMTLKFSGGRLGSIVINRLAKGENHYFDARVDTTTESFRASFGGRARVTAGLHRAKSPHLRFDYGVSGLAWKEMGSTRHPLGRNPADPRMVATKEVISRTLAAFENGTEPPCSAEWARDVSLVIDAAYRSAELGRTEKVNGSARTAQ